MSSISGQLVARLAGGGFVSGEQMAARLGVSRAAVNQHIARLRALGVEIHSVRGRGYRLAQPLEVLDAERIRGDLAGAAGAQLRLIEVLESVDSTNRHMKASRASGRALDACFAEYQSAGRGRRGRTWLAAPYASILMSLAHELPGGPAASSGLSLAAGVAAARAAAQFGCDDVALKWPNDLMLGGAKFGGILVEIAGELGERCHCVVGIGLNADLPSALAAQCAQPVTSLSAHASGPVSRNALAAALLNQLVAVLEVFNAGGFAALRDEWTARHASQDRTIRVSLGESVLTGTARGVDDDGALRVETADGSVRRITTGEVTA